MANYKRAWQPGGTWFFTVVLAERQNNHLLVERIDLLRKVVREVQESHPFRIHGWVVLPEHLHALLELPDGDTNFPLRWRRIKSKFSRAIPNSEVRSESRWRRGERGIWQRRYWEHLVRDQEDFNNHLDYIHINPVKHGLVTAPKDWPYSTFHRWVQQGRYPLTWGNTSMPEYKMSPDNK
ncbi:REP-associated tyrosine transposase [Aeromonas media]|uniref:REP-associated tyrosine transposase n=1 Tax=Aeromonas media TaxID=651 RepID=UPI0029D5AE69|nr:transposase [Aeromonas media]MDX7897842.1 transposase [Aeromonas media]